MKLLDRHRSTRYIKGESPLKKEKEDLLWNSLSTLFDFCHETLELMNKCRNRRRLLYDCVYLSAAFDDMAKNTFRFEIKFPSDYF